MDLIDFEGFLQKHEKDIFSFCSYLTMDNDIADDLYQDTVLQAFEMIDKIDITKNPKSFFFSIAIGKWKNVRRKAGRRNQIAPAIQFTDIIEEVAGGDDLERHVQNNLLRSCIQDALAKMDDKFRIPIILFYFEGSSEEAISKICKIPKGTVKSRLHKGRELLKEVLIKEGYDYD